MVAIETKGQAAHMNVFQGSIDGNACFCTVRLYPIRADESAAATAQRQASAQELLQREPEGYEVIRQGNHNNRLCEQFYQVSWSPFAKGLDSTPIM